MIAPAPLFDGYMAVDWSASGTPKTGADSIWIACTGWGGEEILENPPTRAAAIGRIESILESARHADRRLLCGFDFPFGYPAGTARAVTGQDGWSGLWARIAALIEDDESNANNRFDAAARLNESFPGDGPFWGNGLKRDIPGLPRKKPDGWGAHLPANRRVAEESVKGTQEVWKLSGAGSVGGQALTGIAALERLRWRIPAQVWPFETLGDGPGHVLAEIYPSIAAPAPGVAPKDAGQVRAIVAALAALDATGALRGHLEAPAALGAPVISEEAAILGMTDPGAFRTAAAHAVEPAPVPAYERDPARIYEKSFATVRAEARLDRFAPDEAELAIRLIHACGMVDLACDLHLSPGVVVAARAALGRGAPVLCDCDMVASGIIRRALPAGVEVVSAIADPRAAAHAAEIGNTRSAAAMDLLRDRLGGAVVAIGNAPTALFRLLEMLDEGAPRPAAILAFPVGFVGAAESKAALAATPRGVPFATLKGRRGGSAMAAAAVNAAALGLRGDGT